MSFKSWVRAKNSWAVCCTLLSCFAVIFLVIIGGALEGGTHQIEVDEGQQSSAATQCFVAAAIYAVFFVVCGLAWMYNRQQAKQEEMMSLTQLRVAKY